MPDPVGPTHRLAGSRRACRALGGTVRPPGPATRSGHPVRPPGSATRFGHPVPPPGSAARSGHEVRPRGPATRSGHEVRPPGSATRSGHPVRPPGPATRSGRPLRPRGPAARSGHEVRPRGPAARSGRPLRPPGPAAGSGRRVRPPGLAAPAAVVRDAAPARSGSGWPPVRLLGRRGSGHSPGLLRGRAAARCRRSAGVSRDAAPASVAGAATRRVVPLSSGSLLALLACVAGRSAPGRASPRARGRVGGLDSHPRPAHDPNSVRRNDA
jgi:hypothetical protein